MTQTKRVIELIGYGSGIGAGNKGCRLGPSTLKSSPQLKKLQDFVRWQPILTPNEERSGLQALESITSISRQLGTITAQLTRENKFFITLGGDHSSAIGTWSGVASVISPNDLGLIWIDAHLDSHTFGTSPSGNIHGMPLAVLLHQGHPDLTQLFIDAPKLKPKNVCVIGVRSFEKEEQHLLEELNVRIFYMPEILARGLDAVLKEAHHIVTEHSQFFGISLDLDAIQPEEAPGVGTPEPNGIHAEELLATLTELIKDKRLIGAEIVEFNPELDHNKKTETLIADVIKHFNDT